MPIWSFIFPRESDALQSARVAAPSKAWAFTLLGADADAVIVQHCGEAPVEMPGIVQIVYRDGTVKKFVETGIT